jgi:predicted nuclease of predicted toxin-antitoxin system
VKIKLDENMPVSLVAALRRLGHDIHTVRVEQLTGQRDDRIWEAAQREERFLITQDLDFSDVRRFAPGTHHGILLVRLRRPGRQRLFLRTLALFEAEDVNLWPRCFVVATDRKLRVRSRDHS